MNEQIFSLNWWMSATVGVIFIFAGVQKFIARELWPAQAKRLGAPSFAIPTVPYVEVVLGSLLIAGLAQKPCSSPRSWRFQASLCCWYFVWLQGIDHRARA